MSTMVLSIYTLSSMQMAKPTLPCFRRPDRPWKARVSSRYEEAAKNLGYQTDTEKRIRKPTGRRKSGRKIGRIQNSGSS